MTDRRLTPEEIERADAAYRQRWLHWLTLGLIPAPSTGWPAIDAEAKPELEI
jgi:hypothetical protein